MKPYRFARVAVRWITRFQVRHAIDAQAAATLIEIDLLRQEHEQALNAQHDRIESALSAALGDPDLGAYPGDPDGAPDLESLIATVAGLRRQRDEARRERDEMAAAGRAVVEATDEMRAQWAEIEARLEGERDAARAAIPFEVQALTRFYTTDTEQEFWRCLACGGEWPCDIVTACATCHGPKETP